MIAFPILIIKNEENIYFYSNYKTLSRTTIELVESKVFDNTIIYDAQGHTIKIKKVNVRKWANFFGGISLILKGRQVIVDFEFEYLDNISIEKLKELVIVKIMSDKRGIYFNKSAIIEKVSEALSYEQIYLSFR